MYCPRCGEPAPTGSRRCAACGYPFTRSAARSGGPLSPARFGRREQQSGYGDYPSYAPYDDGQSNLGNPDPAYGRDARRRSSHKALGCLAGLILLAVVVVAGVALLSRGVVKPYVGRQLDQHLNLPAIASKLTGNATPSATTTAGEPASQTAVAPTPPAGAHQVVITQDQLNQEIENNKGRIKPLDSASVTMTPGEMQVSMHAYGLSGTYHGQVEVSGGKAELTNGHIDGPLGWIVPVGPVQSALNGQLQSALNQNGLAIDSVTLQQGQMVVAVSPSQG
ncbi:MAG TPA: hypothetical protein VKU87_06160 [Thermomicrobiaceae bacterium]|nr:hypothetical protein [Thermomicrobiaceae bacterium]